MSKEIDRLVAEKVMGWVAYSEVKRDEDIKLPFTRRYWAGKEGNYTNQFHFVPSERIQDAWLVVEEMKKKGMLFNVCTGIDAYDVDIWTYSNLNEGLMPYATLEAETAPMAICLAALKIVGVHIDVPER